MFSIIYLSSSLLIVALDYNSYSNPVLDYVAKSELDDWLTWITVI